MSEKIMGYLFHCRSCSTQLVIRKDSEKIKEVQEDGDVLIKCPCCYSTSLYEKNIFKEIEDISDWPEYQTVY